MDKLIKFMAITGVLWGALSGSSARAQGIPVIDVANLVQSVEQVLDDATAIENQVQQIRQLQSQLQSINGLRNLGQVFNNPLLRNYVPSEAYTLVNAGHRRLLRPEGHGEGVARRRHDLQLHGSRG